MSAKEKLRTFWKALDEAASDTAYYVTPDIVSDAIYAMTPKKMWKYTRKSRDEFNARREEWRENVRKWFKMIGEWAKNAAKKAWNAVKEAAKAAIPWKGLSAAASAAKSAARKAFKK